MADESREIQIEIAPELETGVYANFALVSASDHDFVLDLCQTMPRSDESEPPRVRVVSRVRFAPTFVGPLLQAISQNAFRRDEMIKQAQDPAQGGPDADG